MSMTFSLRCRDLRRQALTQGQQEYCENGEGGAFDQHGLAGAECDGDEAGEQAAERVEAEAGGGEEGDDAAAQLLGGRALQDHVDADVAH